MEIIDKPLVKEQINNLRKQYGNYLKLTVDLENENLVTGCELHADGEKILLKEGGQSSNIWGGGIDLKEKTIDTVAVLNLRPKLYNDSMEILDPKRREKFIQVVKKIFSALWK